MRAVVPGATVSRLPVYLRSLGGLSPDQRTCSSEQLAALAGVNSAQVRKDLSYLGVSGTRGIGYEVTVLVEHLRRALGLTKRYAVVIVGGGNLGNALGNYGGFASWGFEVVAVLDADPAKVGQVVAGIEVEPIDHLAGIVADRDVAIGIIATPAWAAQDVATRLTAAGVRSILNFAPAVIEVPDGVDVRRVDLSTELQILTYHLQERAASIGR